MINGRQLYSITVLIYTIGFLSVACSNENTTDEAYLAKVNEWHNERVQALENKDSWLSLAGLYKLEEGTQSFGSDSANDIIFPPKAPAKMGTITKNGTRISATIASDITVTTGNSKTNSVILIPDNQGEPTTLRHNSLLWYVIERRGNYYIRLKDTKYPNFAKFDGIERFPVNKKWHLKASFKSFKKPKLITIPDILGDTYQDTLYGMLEFTLENEKYNLAPIGHPENDKEFFIILGDQTNGNSTYGGGRYLYIPTPNKEGITYLDFNKAYNPPCVFTHFATCPLPPAQNRLPFKITAGEKMYNK